MSEKFFDQHLDTDTADEDVKQEQEMQRKAAEVAGFKESISGLDKIISQYFQNSDVSFSFKPGGFYIDLETFRVNLDPAFAKKRNLGPSETLFGVFHEAEHLRDMMQNEEAYEDRQLRVEELNEATPGYAKALHRFHNILDDVQVNMTVMGRWVGAKPNMGTLRKDMYSKLFPGTDYRKAPLHKQFGYAMIREIMIPGEKCDVDPRVRAAIDQQKEIVEHISRFNLDKQAAEVDPAVRLGYIEGELEPIFQQFYKTAKEEKEKSPGKDKGKGKPGEPQEGEGDDFDDDDNETDDMLDQVDHDDLLEQVKKLNKALSQKKDDQFRKTFDVSLEDYQWYQKEFKKIEPYLEEMVEFFKRFIQERILLERIKVLKKTGDYVSPHLINEAFIRFQTGTYDDARIFVEKAYKAKMQETFTDFELIAVTDGSGSVKSDYSKHTNQRRGIILLTEAISHFEDYVASINQGGESLQMSLKTQIREFSDNDILLKDFNEKLDLRKRVELAKSLTAEGLTGGGNNEIASFDEIEKYVRTKLPQILAGKLKLFIIFTTDGESDSAAISQRVDTLYAMCQHVPNFKLMGYGMGPGTDTVAISYAPHGRPNVELARLAENFTQDLEEFIEA